MAFLVELSQDASLGGELPIDMDAIIERVVIGIRYSLGAGKHLPLSGRISHRVRYEQKTQHLSAILIQCV